jgi:hypothetical protein
MAGWLLLGIFGSALGANPPSILNNSSHIVGVADAALNVLGVPHTTTLGPSSSILAVNQTCQGDCNGFLAASSIISSATDTDRTQYAATPYSNAVKPSVPYQVINQSSAGYTLAGFEQANYTALLDKGLIYVMAYCGTPTVDEYPPTAFVTVLPNNRNAYAPGNGCGYAQGIEFSIPVDVGGCTSTCTWTPVSGGGSIDVSSPSATTEAMSAVVAALKLHHPLWTWGDVKSVLRATASNWSSGYVASNISQSAYGYGNINYGAADSYGGTIYLQPPGFSVTLNGTGAALKLYPFVTSRRAGEVIYAFQQRPVLPAPSANNEYSYAQVTALASTYGGSLIYNSSGASGIQLANYVAPSIARRFFVAFTVDNTSTLSAASFSRAEEFLIHGADFGSQKRALVIQMLLN